jgi:hypothetical protein
MIPVLYLLRHNQSDCLFSTSSEVFINIERWDYGALDRSSEILNCICVTVNHFM